MATLRPGSTARGLLLFLVFALLASGSALANTFVVNSTADGNDQNTGNGTCATGPPSPVCTLRAAIQEANALPGPDVIFFNIGTGLVTIAPGSTLPAVTETLTIDGTSQPGYAGTPIVEIDATLTGTQFVIDLVNGSSGSTIRGLIINRSQGTAINILRSSNNVIAGNFLGTDATGSTPSGNGVGVFIQGNLVDPATDNRIGGTAAADRNVISGNTVDGIQLNGVGTAQTIVEGNHIGLDITGTFPMGNANQGIAIFGGAHDNVVGGTTAGAGNVISANGNDGVLIAQAGTTGNRVEGNYIGTDAAGTSVLGNLRGIEVTGSADSNVIGGAAAGAGNVISGNTLCGISVNGSNNNTIQGNRIGTDATGTADLGNLQLGVQLLGGATNNLIGGVSGNVISGNDVDGVEVIGAGSSGNRVTGNIIGLDASGTVDLGNSFFGVVIAQGATGNIIGEAGNGNVISGNDQFGIRIVDPGTNDNLVQGNLIGLDASGSVALGNASDGIRLEAGGGPASGNLIGGSTPALGNVISGNGGVGVQIVGAMTASVLSGNTIGLDVNGVTAVPNATGGVLVSNSSGHTIGGLSLSEGNVIGSNGGAGIAVVGTSTTNAVIGNSVFSNAGLGIDLENDGVTPNDSLDADTGANDHLNYPMLTSAVESTGSLTVSFLLDVPAGSYRIELFKNPAGADPSGYGEGRFLASTTTVTHPGGGATAFNDTFPGAFGDVITATATFCVDGAPCTVLGSTSEFSNAVTAVGGVTFSSASNQSFTVGDPSTPMFASDIVVSAAGVITTTNDIRIRIPSGFPMRWNPAQTSLVRGGSAAVKVAPAVLGFEDAGRTVVVDVTSDFTSGDQLTLSGLEFFSFTAPAPAARLELETANDGLVIALDDKTKQILPDAVPTLSSDDDQTFVTGQPATLMVPLTVSEGLSPSIKLGSDIRVRIPASLSMTWDSGVTMPFFFGPGAAKVASAVSFEDFDRTLVIDVQTDFASGDFLTVSGLYFQGFGASPPSNLELEVDNLGGVIDLDDKTIQIDLATDVPVFTATATDTQVKLEWVFPAGNCNFVRIVRDTGAFPAWNDPVLVDDVPCGTAGTKGSLVDSPLTPNTTYFYSAYVDYGGGYTPGKFLKARPFDNPPSIHWAYSTGATSMAPPSLRFALPDSFVYFVSNDSILHSIRGGSLGGDWPGTWTPYVLGGPAQTRFPVVSFSVGGANGAAFLGSQDGRVYAVDAVNGALTWDEPVASMVQAAPAGHFTAYNAAAFDLILVGTRNGSGANAFVALDVDTGAPQWSFTNTAAQGGDNTPIGIISGGASVDYTNNRAYFASRTNSGGSTSTLWCVTFNGSSVTRVWSRALGNIDGSPVLKSGKVYVGTNSGVLYALDAATGALHWSLSLGDGAIKGFPFTGAGNLLFLSTNNKVWSIADNGSSGSVSPGWPVTSIPSPSIPLHIPGTTNVLVGSSDGNLYQMNVVTPLPAKSVTLGDGSAAVGAPTMDLLQMLLYVGTDAGVVYGVTYPIP